MGSPEPALLMSSEITFTRTQTKETTFATTGGGASLGLWMGSAPNFNGRKMKRPDCLVPYPHGLNKREVPEVRELQIKLMRVFHLDLIPSGVQSKASQALYLQQGLTMALVCGTLSRASFTDKSVLVLSKALCHQTQGE